MCAKLKIIFYLISLPVILSLIACSKANSVSDSLNPFTDGNQLSEEQAGQRNTDAIMGGGGGAGSATAARNALEVMGSYRKALPPEPTYPVIKPAEVRLMWIPDRLNALGDLIPAHYYYLNVLPDRPAVTDAFEVERQLDVTRGGGGGALPTSLGTDGAGGSTPWVYKETR